MPIVFAAVAPHGDLAIPEVCAADDRDRAAATQAGMRELEARAWRSRPDAVIVISPHHLHIEGAMAVVTAGRVAGELRGEGNARVELDCAVDRTLARALLDGLAEENVPAVGVSYGGNAPDEAVMPMDWGTLIPLWYLGGRWNPPLPVVLMAPARDLGPAAHVRAGAAIGAVAAASPRRILLIASADQSHTHDPAGPYGGDPSAAVFDRLVVDAVETNDLARLVAVSEDLIEAAKPDAWWQMLMLHGALHSTAPQRWRAALISYEAPTYYGMVCAAFEPES